MFRYLTPKQVRTLVSSQTSTDVPVKLFNSVWGTSLAHVVALELEASVGSAFLHKSTELLLGFSGCGRKDGVANVDLTSDLFLGDTIVSKVEESYSQALSVG